jgi:hypothetical protein
MTTQYSWHTVRVIGTAGRRLIGSDGVGFRGIGCGVIRSVTDQPKPSAFITEAIAPPPPGRANRPHFYLGPTPNAVHGSDAHV